jgi:uncharacterized sodium:solute symporter family permease YidK
MNDVPGTLIAKSLLVAILSVGVFVLIALGKVTFAEGVQGITTLAGAMVIALGLRGAAAIGKD